MLPSWATPDSRARNRHPGGPHSHPGGTPHERNLETNCSLGVRGMGALTRLRWRCEDSPGSALCFSSLGISARAIKVLAGHFCAAPLAPDLLFPGGRQHARPVARKGYKVATQTTGNKKPGGLVRAKCLNFLGWLMGLEPTTTGITILHGLHF